MGAGASLSAQQKVELQEYIKTGKTYLKTYSKEAYKVVRAGVKEGKRLAVNGIEVARAIARQVDPTNSRRNKAIAAALAERRAALLQNKRIVSTDEDDDAPAFEIAAETPTDPLIVIEGDADNVSEQDIDQPAVGDIFEEDGNSVQAQAKQPNSTKEKVEVLEKQRHWEGQALKIVLANKISDENLLEDLNRRAKESTAVKSVAHSLLQTSMAVAVFKKGMHTRINEKLQDKFGAATASQDNWSSDIAGWNLSHHRPFVWTSISIYIIRCNGDCQREVDLIYSDIVPRLQQVMLAGAIVLEVRDLGPERFQNAVHTSISLKHTLDALLEPNAIRIILLGGSYGANVPDVNVYLTEEWSTDIDSKNASLLDIMCTVASKTSAFSVSGSVHGNSRFRTLVYSCVDPQNHRKGDSAGIVTSLAPHSATSRTSHDHERAGEAMSPWGKQKNSVRKAESSPGFASPSSPYKSSAADTASLRKSSMISNRKLNPLAMVRKKQAEAVRIEKEKVLQISALVFKALCQDPQTGKARPPYQIFMDLDEDGGGTVDKEEFFNGVQLCGVTLEQAEIDLLWKSLDSEQAGELDFETLGAKLQEQYEKVLQQELKDAGKMPYKLSLKLERFLPRDVFRARIDTVKDFMDTSEKQDQRWLKEFSKRLFDDMQRLIPLVGVSSFDHEFFHSTMAEHGEPLCYCPEIPEYVAHAHLIFNLSSSTFGDGEASFRLEALKTELFSISKQNSPWPTVLIGGKGTGKTSIMAKFVSDLVKARPFDHVIFVSIGHFPGSSELPLMLLQICMEIGKRFQTFPEVMTQDVHSIEEVFPKLLMKLAIETVLVIVLDGFDMMVKNGQPLQDLSWFPDTIPAKVHFFFSCDECSNLELLRKVRSKYSGPTEINEIKVSSSEQNSDGRQSGTGSNGSTPNISRASSAISSHLSAGQRSAAMSHDGDFDTKDENNLMHINLSTSSLFASAQKQGSSTSKAVRTGIKSMIFAMIDCACNTYGPGAIRRYILLVCISRNGVLEQDLYELLNANSSAFPQIPFCRISWQEFSAIKILLSTLIHGFPFGHGTLLDVKHQYFRKILLQFFEITQMDKIAILYHRLIALHYQQKLPFLQNSGVWHGEHYRAVTEISYHFSQACMWTEVMGIMTSLKYIEVRCSLGMPQAFALLCDYYLVCSNKLAEAFWIKTDLLKLKDCYAMVKRYCSILSRHPIWTFSIAASLPDTTGPSRVAKASWTVRNETRPQLVWLNKPAGRSPCETKISEPKMVMQSSCFSHDMTRLVIVGQDRTVFVWTVPDAVLLCELHGHLDYVTACDISADDRYILSSSADGKVLLWRMPDLLQQTEAESSSEDEEMKKPDSNNNKKHKTVLQDNQISVIAAHNNTAWTCAFSSSLTFEAEICRLNCNDERASVDSILSGSFARNDLPAPSKNQIPVSLRGTVQWTHKFSDEEKRKIKLNRSLPRPYDANRARETLRSNKQSNSSQQKLSFTSAEVENYDNQAELRGKIVIFSLTAHASEEFLWNIVAEIFALGAIALILVNEMADTPTQLSRTTPDAVNVESPVLSVGKSTGSKIQNNDYLEIRRKLGCGSMIASGSSDCSVKIWDLQEAIRSNHKVIQPKAVLEYHRAYISHVSFSHYGHQLASSSGDFMVVVWNLSDFSPAIVYSECLAPAMCSVWSPDDSMIGTACHDGYFRIWNVKEVRTLKASQGPHTGHMWACAFANNDKYFATAGHEGTVVLWDIKQMLTHNKEVMVFQGHSGPVFSCNFSEDSARIVTASADRTVRVWRTDRDLEDYALSHMAVQIDKKNQDLKAKQSLREILANASKGWTYAGAAKIFWECKAHQASVSCVCFSPDGFELLTAGADFNIKVWSIKSDLPQPAITRSLRGHEAAVTSLCYARDGSQIASGCASGLIIVWDSKTGRRIHEFRDHTDKIWSVHIHPSSRRLISSSADCTVRLWRLDDPLSAMKKPSTGLTIYSDSDEEDDQDQLGSRSNSTPEKANSDSDGKRTVNILDESATPILQEIHTNRIVYSCSFAPNGKWMATGSADSLIQLYRFKDESMTSLEEFKTLPPDGLESPDRHRSYVRKVLFDFDSRRILSCGVDSTLKLWSTRNGLRLRTYSGHEKEVWTCSITSDAKALVSCSLDGTARVWNLESGEELFRIKHNETIFACDFSPDSRFMVTGSYDGIVRLWEKDRMDYKKKQSRGWPRVRDLLSKIARLKDVPSALSLDGRLCCYVKENMEHLVKNSQVKKALKQTITMEHTVTGHIEYSFVLNNPADFAAIGGKHFDTIIFVSATILRSYVLGNFTSQIKSGHKAAILDIRFAENSISFATASEDSLVIVWKVEQGTMTRLKKLKGHTSCVMSVCFSPNGQLLASGGQDLCFKLWDTNTWKTLCTIAQAHTNYVTCCAFDAPGHKMLSGGEDRCIRIWTLPKRLARNSLPRESVRIRHLRSTVICADFTEDGSRVVAVLSHHQIHVWHATKGVPLCSWDFSPFDAEKYTGSLWRTGTLALTNGLNAAIVTDSAGNTMTFGLLRICSSNPETEES